VVVERRDAGSRGGGKLCIEIRGVRFLACFSMSGGDAATWGAALVDGKVSIGIAEDALPAFSSTRDTGSFVAPSKPPPASSGKLGSWPASIVSKKVV